MKKEKITFDIETQGMGFHRVMHTYYPDVYNEILEDASRIMNEVKREMDVRERVRREVALDDRLYLQQIHSL